MSKYFRLFVLILLMLTVTSTVVMADTEVEDPSFIEIKDGGKDDRVISDAGEGEDSEETEEGDSREKEIICKKTPPEPQVKFKLQIVYPNPAEDNFKVEKLTGVCDADQNRALAQVIINAPKRHNGVVESFMSWFSKDQYIRLEKAARCKATDKIITFWVDENIEGINVICGEESTSDGNDSIDYGDNNYSGNYSGGNNNQPWYEQTAEQAAAGHGGQQRGQGYGSYQDTYNDWRDNSGPEWTGLEDENFYEDNYNDDDWDDNDLSDDINTGGTVNDQFYGSVGNDTVLPQASNEEFYYYDEPYFDRGDWNTDDAIDKLLGGYTPSNQASLSGVPSDLTDDWGVLDSQDTWLSLQEIYSIPTYEEFVEYYSGSISEKEWGDWREWVFAHNSSTWSVNFDDSFYEDDSTQYAWYNPYGWWMSFNRWLTEVNPASPQYDI
ncbi:MAG: hypothetical protein LRZ97_00800 [Candidatus Pacebacteria bacterium]|nr:hypothetical protein [Candidatus Paceibacterota bacterium]